MFNFELTGEIGGVHVLSREIHEFLVVLFECEHRLIRPSSVLSSRYRNLGPQYLKSIHCL